MGNKKLALTVIASTVIVYYSLTTLLQLIVPRNTWPSDFVQRSLITRRIKANSGPWQPPIKFNSSLDRYLVYSREVKPFIDNYVLAKKDKCTNETTMVVLVTSAPANFDRRAAIRETWAADASRKLNISTFFLLGASQNSIEMESIRLEDEKQDDIIQWPFIDTYNDLTVKSLLMLSWLRTECPQAKLAMKTDDDMYIDVEKFAQNLLRPRIRGRKAMVGFLIKAPVMRNSTHRHALPRRVYSQAEFPVYMSGTLYVMTQRAIGPLYKAALSSLPALFLEDVFMTGFMASKAKIERFYYQNAVAYWSCKTRSKERWLLERAAIGHRCTAADLRRIHGQRRAAALQSGRFNVSTLLPAF